MRKDNLRKRPDNNGHFHNDTKGPSSPSNTSQEIGLRVHGLSFPVDHLGCENLLEPVTIVGRERSVAAIRRPPDIPDEAHRPGDRHDTLGGQRRDKVPREDAAADPGRRLALVYAAVLDIPHINGEGAVDLGLAKQIIPARAHDEWYVVRDAKFNEGADILGVLGPGNGDRDCRVVYDEGCAECCVIGRRRHGVWDVWVLLEEFFHGGLACLVLSLHDTRCSCLLLDLSWK